MAYVTDNFARDSAVARWFNKCILYLKKVEIAVLISNMPSSIILDDTQAESNKKRVEK